MLTFRQLHQELGIPQRLLRQLVDEGLPCEAPAEGGGRLFDRATVDRWLIEHGYAEVEGPGAGQCGGGQVVQTLHDLAQALDMKGKDPIRQISRWILEPGFPGRSGSAGRRDGYFPVDQIRLWLAARNGGGNSHNEELAELKIERERLRLEREIRDEMLAAGRLADVDEVAQHNARCVANAKAVLEPMADAVVGILPTRAPSAKQWTRVLRQVHGAVQQLLDDAYAEIEGMISGDTDDTSDDDY
jgi:DNA-binding transcriptional MerR regulator